MGGTAVPLNCHPTIRPSRRRFAARLNSGVRHHGWFLVNWKLTAKYALCLLLVQFVIGFFEGLLTPVSHGVAEGVRYFFMGIAAYLFGSVAVFFALSARHSNRRWGRAALVLLVYIALCLAIELLSSIWLASTPIVLSIVGWLGAAASGLVGTAAGALYASHAAVAASQPSRQDA